MCVVAQIGAMPETVFAPINCKCGAGPFEDREAWVEHVREGMPSISRPRKRPDFRRQEAEQSVMMDYIASHGIVGILPEENQRKESE